MKIRLLFEKIIIKKLNEHKITVNRANDLLMLINEKSERELIDIVGHDWFDNVSDLINEGITPQTSSRIGNTGRGTLVGGALGATGAASKVSKHENNDLMEDDENKDSEIDPVTVRRKYRNSIIGVAHGIPMGMLAFKSDINIINYLLKKYPNYAKKTGLKAVKGSAYGYAKAGIKGGIEGAVLWGAYRLARSIFDSCSGRCGTFKFNDRDRQMCLKKCKEAKYKQLMANIKK